MFISILPLGTGIFPNIFKFEPILLFIIYITSFTNTYPLFVVNNVNDVPIGTETVYEYNTATVILL